MKRFVHFLLLLGIWLLLTWSLHWQDLLVGVIIALIAELLLGDIYPVNAVKILNPVRWEDSMRYMLQEGFDQFYEVGPGRVLRGLLRRVERKISCQSVNV